MQFWLVDEEQAPPQLGALDLTGEESDLALATAQVFVAKLLTGAVEYDSPGVAVQALEAQMRQDFQQRGAERLLWVLRLRNGLPLAFRALRQLEVLRFVAMGAGEHRL